MFKINSFPNLIFHHFDLIEEKFLKYLDELIETRPFWWHVFISKVINNPQVTYVKDSTMIITLVGLTTNVVNIIFEIVKSFLKLKVAVRVIKKKEFLIVHLHNKKITEFLKTKDKWLVIPFCKMIKTIYPNYDCFLDVLWKTGSEKHQIDVCVTTPKEIILLNVETPLKINVNDEGVKRIFLANAIKCGLVLDNNYKLLKYSYDKTQFKKDLKSSFQSLAISS